MPGRRGEGAPLSRRHDPWRADVLGAGWESCVLPVPDDEQGPAVVTLVRRAGPRASRRAVLYVHGYVDYFFQTHLADFWHDLGYDFYAVDLRAYGRSLLAHQLPNYVTELARHGTDLDVAARVVRDEEGHDELVVMGHSTGALVACLWAHARRGRPDGPLADALVLNSPWLQLNRPWLTRAVVTAGMEVLGPVAPRVVVGQIARHYGESLHRDTGGDWDFDLRWKPHEGFGVRAGWLRTVRRAHRSVARGLEIDVPVLVCAAGSSGPYDRRHDRLDSTDSVLSVEHIVARAPLLGTDVTVVQVPGGVHDLALSPEPARSHYLDSVRDWMHRRADGVRPW